MTLSVLGMLTSYVPGFPAVAAAVESVAFAPGVVQAIGAAVGGVAGGWAAGTRENRKARKAAIRDHELTCPARHEKA